MSTEVTLSKEDQEIADQLQDLITGGDGEEVFFEELEQINIPDKVEGGRGGPSTSSVGKALTDGNDMRRLLSDLIE